MSNNVDSVRVSNLTMIAQTVDITLADGLRTSVRVMPKARGVSLPPGAKVSGNWLALNPNCIAVINPQPKMQPNDDDEGED